MGILVRRVSLVKRAFRLLVASTSMWFLAYEKPTIHEICRLLNTDRSLLSNGTLNLLIATIHWSRNILATLELTGSWSNHTLMTGIMAMLPFSRRQIQNTIRPRMRSIVLPRSGYGQNPIAWRRGGVAYFRSPLRATNPSAKRGKAPIPFAIRSAESAPVILFPF